MYTHKYIYVYIKYIIVMSLAYDYHVMSLAYGVLIQDTITHSTHDTSIISPIPIIYDLADSYHVMSLAYGVLIQDNITYMTRV